MNYTVRYTEATRAAILQQARYIAIDCEAPLNAERWLEQMWEAIDSLAQMPRRFPIAPEDEHHSYELRKVNVGDCMLLFTVDDEAATVYVVGLRHGARLPRPDDLPDAPPTQGGAV